MLFSNPMAGFGGYPGAMPFGRKRSISDSLLTDDNLIEMMSSVGSAIEKQFKKYNKSA